VKIRAAHVLKFEFDQTGQSVAKEYRISDIVFSPDVNGAAMLR